MIIFYVASLTEKSASARYRAMLPAAYLSRTGVRAEVHTGIVRRRTLRKAECLVIVKAFSSHTVRLCALARQLGVPIVFDLCDDIFEEGYGALGGGTHNQFAFRAMAALASSIVTTTSTLAAKIRLHTPQGTVVHIIPDMAEREEDIAFLRSTRTPLRQTKREQLRRSWQRLRKNLKRLPRTLSGKPASGNGHLAERSERKSPNPPAPTTGPEKVILWFGNHGSEYSDTGMTQLLWVAADLEKLARKYPIRLVVVSNSRQKFERYIEPLPFPTEYVEWTPTVIYQEMKRAAVCVVPFGHDAFSLSKSPNRVVLSLSLGVPVVCTEIPSLGELKDAVLIGNWYRSIEAYLNEPATVARHLETGRDVIRRNYSGERIAELWTSVVKLARNQRGVGRLRPRLLCFIQLAQDLDLLDPIIRAAGEHFEVAVGVLGDLALSSPGVLEALGRQRTRTFFLHRLELEHLDARDPRIRADIVVTASESSADRHAAVRHLVEAAKAAGAVTFTLQSGARHAGQVDRELAPDEPVDLASDYVLWPAADAPPNWMSPAARDKLVPLGNSTTAAPSDWVRCTLAVLRLAAEGAERDRLVVAAASGGDAADDRPASALLRNCHSLLGDVSDDDLSELNALLPWNVWVKDSAGRAFGSSFSYLKRPRPDPLPDPRIVELDRLVPLRDKIVLEIGCFEGIRTAALCDFAAHVKACDVRIGQIAKTAVRCTFLGARPELFLWNAERPLPDRDISADVLHHVDVLHGLKDPLTHLQRVLPKIRHAILLDTHIATDADATGVLEAGGRAYRTRVYQDGGLTDPSAGTYDHANWLLLDDLVAVIRQLGFGEILVNRVSDQEEGRRVTLVARRPTGMAA